MMAETRARRRIREAVESRGYKVSELTWEPVYNAGEMAGWAGGWTLTTDRPFLANAWPGDDLGGLSVDELLAEIDQWLRPSEPCACDQGPMCGDLPRSPAFPLRGDPEKPLHEPSCPWHIAYRMRWWTEVSA